VKDITALATNWQKSSFSNEQGSCVEVTAAEGGLKLRESDDPGVIVMTTPSRLRALLVEVRSGVFDGLLS
jgi:hypothetical protein